ncbi:MAG: DUF2637 domain-containing protein [Pseudonocardiaceae bacterium]
MSAAPVAPAAPGRAVRAVTVAAVLLVAAVAAVVSYAHMQTVADRAGEGWRAWLLPLSVDGLVVAASMALLTRRRVGVPGGWLPWCALLAGVGASRAANVAAAEPTTTARVVAAWPALAFAVAFELLLQQRRTPVGAPVVDEPPTAHPVVDRLDQPDEPGDQMAPAGDPPVEPVVVVDPLAARLGELVATAHTEGRPLGRRTVARELCVTEYRAGQLLARTSNGQEGTP